MQDNDDMAIVTMKQVIRERINACADAGAHQFRNSVRPIYGVNSRGVPELVASGILLEIGGIPYVVTAAHVVDEARKWGFHLGTQDKLVPIVGEFSLTAAPNGDRRLDAWDFAWCRLSTGDAASLEFIPEGRIARIRHKGHRLYLALGYPGSKNNVNPTGSRIVPKLARFSDTEKEVPALCRQLKVTGEHHILVGFDSKWSIESTSGEKTRTFKPHGMSGGALLDMGDMGKIENYTVDTPCEGTLAGLLLSNHRAHKVICAVTAAFIVDRILKR